MKKVFFMILAAILSSAALFAQDKVERDTLSILKDKKELLELHLKLTKLNIKLLDKKEDRIKIEQNANEMNKKADRLTKDYATSDEVSSTVTDSKEARKLLAKTEKANKKLSKINKTIRDLESDIKSVEREIIIQRLAIEFTEK